MAQMMITGLLCGGLLGFVMQRGRFCITGAFRDLYVTKDNRMFIALLIAIAIQSIGIFSLTAFHVIQVPEGSFMWLATITGGYLFGIGIVLAGGCATGTWYRAGEGLIGSWIALFAYMLSSAAMKGGALKPATNAVQSYTAGNEKTIYGSLGISPWLLVALLILATGYFVYKEWQKPKIPIPSMKPRKTGLSHLLFEKRWHPFFTAALVGLIAILAWPLSSATGRMYGLGITTPSANLMQYVVSGDLGFINWGVFLVLGIFAGSFIAARASGEFRFRAPDVKTALKSFSGGIIMGIGASLAGGCSIGNGLVETAFFGWQGWVSLPCMILGTWTAAYFTIIRPSQRSRKPHAAA